MHFQQTVAALSKAAIVRGHHQGHSLGSHKVKQQIKDKGTGSFVERTSWLVCQKDLRFVHQRTAKRSALSLSTGELLNAMAEPVRQAGAICKLPEARVRCAPIDPGGNCGDEAILFQREIRNEVMELKDKAHFMPEQMQKTAMTIDSCAIHGNVTLVWRIKTAEQMKECALAAARWAAQRNSLALDCLEAYPLQHCDCPVVVALPHILRRKNNALRIARLRNGQTHSKRSASTARIRIA